MVCSVSFRQDRLVPWKSSQRSPATHSSETAHPTHSQCIITRSILSRLTTDLALMEIHSRRIARTIPSQQIRRQFTDTQMRDLIRNIQTPLKTIRRMLQKEAINDPHLYWNFFLLDFSKSVLLSRDREERVAHKQCAESQDHHQTGRQ